MLKAATYGLNEDLSPAFRPVEPPAWFLLPRYGAALLACRQITSLSRKSFEGLYSQCRRRIDKQDDLTGGALIVKITGVGIMSEVFE